MNPWLDAIDKLRFHGYSVTLIEGRLRYTYRGKGKPPQDEIIPLLEVLKTHKKKILQDPNFLIDQTLLEINQAYLEARDGLKDSPQWKALSGIEQEINRAALGNDPEGLERALRVYKRAALTAESAGSQGELF